MINFYRKIRRQLANENKFQKYFRYAFGEILLVVIGILVALQVNNWNEQRKQGAIFKVTLEQIYNSLKFDTDDFNGKIQAHDQFIANIGLLLEQPDSIEKYYLPYFLHGFRLDPTSRKSEIEFHINNLNYNPKDPKQNEISKQIINYVKNLEFYNISLFDDFEAELKQIHLAYPKVDYSTFNAGFVTNDSSYYSNDDLENAYNLVRSVAFRALLKSLRTEAFFQKATILVRYGDGISLMNIIKKYYPDVKLLYQDVGLKGTAIDGFDNVGGLSTPMVKTDPENEVWETDIYLLQGKIKFRCRDSWAQNWGGTAFPKGIGYQDGADIPVSEEGNYHVIFKPATGEYEFIKQDD